MAGWVHGLKPTTCKIPTVRGRGHGEQRISENRKIKIIPLPMIMDGGSCGFGCVTPRTCDSVQRSTATGERGVMAITIIITSVLTCVALQVWGSIWLHNRYTKPLIAQLNDLETRMRMVEGRTKDLETMVRKIRAGQ